MTQFVSMQPLTPTPTRISPVLVKLAYVKYAAAMRIATPTTDATTALRTILALPWKTPGLLTQTGRS
ncbi:hypothetical protein GCM10009661_30660 [Catellatospora chokoriensis]|uniref:Uncharacterized protein n=1 Tax=Catellatospora chokoriensis TaxID=310353 RepID=A0A8J3NRL9_9ACTN|nr:hypothetical protein Cch02nite_29920 [Catellatospora chokoriensis]